MVFNSDIFLFIFLPVVFTLFWLARSRNQRYVLLTVSSYIFYGYWNWRFCGLLLFSSLFSFVIGVLIGAVKDRRTARGLVMLSVGADLTILGIFKYYGFFMSSVHNLGLLRGVPLLDVALPIGISFYTFHTISYIVDIYARRIKPSHNLLEYLTYVSLFSQLVAGPIVRFRQIEDDLDHIDHAPRERDIATGIGFFVVGLIKKVVVADSIAGYVNALLRNQPQMSTTAAWIAALGFTFQLYYDFSGYSDMAIGLGYMFGLHIPQNFNAPYRALGIGDFWRRWHMSLSSWLRDYLYIPLGGNRRGHLRTQVNLLITMVLGGLWHGAAWTFVIWGAYHGVLLVLDRALQPWLRRLPALVYRWLTFLLIVVGWVFFRATSLRMALHWLGQMAGLGSGALRPSIEILLWVAVCFLAVNVLPETWDIRFSARARWSLAYAAGFVLAYICMNGASTVYLYYRF